MAAPLQIGRYVLHGEIASGGMASVHFGRLVGTGGFAKTVAIKRLHRALAQTPSFRKMILEEGRLAARVRHPNVVPPLDVLAEGGELLLVMEYVHGESLSKLMRASRDADERVPLPVGAAIMANVLHGLHAAHEAKDEGGKPLDIVHRDVSPQNIIVGVDGIARVIDFGIAKAVTSEDMTSAGTIKGKVPYLSPEQLEGDPATRRTDIYATAVVFWEVLAGRRLFSGEDDSEILRQIMGKKIDPPSAFNPLVAGTVDDVVLRALSRDPEDRYATARDMALDLESAVHLATASVVGAWTERLAATTLAERAERLREVEIAPPLEDPTAAKPPTVRPQKAAGPASTARPPPLPSKATRPPPAPAPPAPSTRTAPPPAPAPPVPSTRTAPPPAPAPKAPSTRTAPPPPFGVTAAMPAAGAMPAIPAPPPKGAPRISIPQSQRGGPPSSAPGATASMPPSSPTGPPSQLRASTPPVRPPTASRPVIEPRTVIYEPPPMPEPDFIEGVRALAPGPPAPGPGGASLPSTRRGAAPLSPPPAGALRKPELEIRNVDWMPVHKPKTEQTSLFRRFLWYLGMFLVLAIIVAWMFAPAIARAWIVTGAASRGIVVTIDRVDVSRKAIRLSDVHAESAEVPGASLRAGTLVIGLRWLVPAEILLDDAELTLDGSYGTVATRFDQFRARHGATLTEPLAGIQKIEVTSGHVDWRNMLGSGTSALVENITGDITKNPVRMLGDDYHFTAPLFTMRLAGAPAGPWQIDVDRQGILVRSVLKFDPSGSYPASITRTAGDDGSISLALAVPPTSLADLHVPAAVLAGAGTDRTRLEAHGEVTVVAVSQATTHGADASVASADGGRLDAGALDGGAALDGGDGGKLAASAGPILSRSVSGRVILGAYGIAVFPSGPSVDLSLDLPLAGDAARPIPVAGVLSFAGADPAGGPSKGAAVAAVRGSIDATGPAVRVELAGQSGAIPCMRAAPAAGVAPSPPTGKEPTNGVVATIVMTLDDLPGARVSLQPQAQCVPKLR